MEDIRGSIHDLEAFGITTIFADTNDLADLESKITDKTRVIFAETIGNPKLDVTDIPALAGIAKRHNLPLMIDNTVATAVGFVMKNSNT